MARDILIEPHKDGTGTASSTTIPRIDFNGKDAETIKLFVDDDGTVRYEGSVNDLLTLTDNATGLLFSVNDISGLSIMEAYDTGQVIMGEPLQNNFEINPTQSYVVKMSSSDQGILLPSLTTSERDSIGTPDTGLLLFNESSGKFNFYTGATWSTLDSNIGGATGIDGSGAATQIAYFVDADTLTSASSFTTDGTDVTMTGDLNLTTSTSFISTGTTPTTNIATNPGIYANSGANVNGFQHVFGIRTSSVNGFVIAVEGTTPTAQDKIFSAGRASNNNTFRFNDAVTDAGGGTIIFNTNSGETVFNESGNDVNFRIEGDTDVNLFKLDAGLNNIGIGTSVPSSSAKLHVVGNQILTGDLTVDIDTLYVNSSNNRVGIGTLSPSQSLHVSGDSEMGGTIYQTLGVGARGRKFDLASLPTYFIEDYYNSGFKTDWSHAGVVTARINANGESIIGAIDVNGTITMENGTTTYFDLDHSANDTYSKVTKYVSSDGFQDVYRHLSIDRIKISANSDSWFNQGGNFGIGLTGPSTKLHLDGTLQLDNLGGGSVTGYVLTLQSDGTAQWEFNGTGSGSDSSGNGGTVSGTVNTIAKFTGTKTVGDSSITDTGSLVTIGATSSFIGGNVGIGQASANGALLALDDTLGDKLFLYDHSSPYGFGIQGGLMQSFVPTAASQVWGSGDSGTFTERMNLSSTQLDVHSNLFVGTSSVGIGQASANGALLALDNTLGDKLFIYDSSTPYGFGVQSGLMQSFVPAAAAHLWGSGDSATFVERMRLNSTGLGIGLVPASKLHVLGNVRVDAANAQGIDITSSGSLRASLQRSSGGDGQLALYTDAGAIDTKIDAATTDNYILSGDFGIGLNNPTEKLHVSGNGLFANNVYSEGGNAEGFIVRISAGNLRAALRRSSGGVGQLELYTGAGALDTKIAADTTDSYIVSGDFGIGLNNPTSKLHLDGTLRLDNLGGSTVSGDVLTLQSDGTAQWEFNGTGSGEGSGTVGPGTTNRVAMFTSSDVVGDGTWAFSTNDLYPLTGGANLGLSASRIGTIYMSSEINYGAGSNLIFTDNGTERMRLDSSGNLGIGRTPTTIFDVEDTNGTTFDFDGLASIGQTAKIIGLTSSVVRFTASDDTTGVSFGIRGSAETGATAFGQQNTAFIVAGSDTNGLNIIVSPGATANDIRFYAGINADDPAHIHIHGSNLTGSIGDVGIGTENPSNKLHVVGDGYFTNHLGLGLGASSPSHILEVDNNVVGQGLRITEGTGFGAEGTVGMGIEFKRLGDTYLGIIFAQDISGFGYLGFNSRAGQRFYDNSNIRMVVGDGGGNGRVTVGSSTHGTGKFSVISTSITSSHAAGAFTVTNTNASNTYTGVSGLADGVGSLINRGGFFEATGGASNYALITGAGNVGIGTSAPSNKLHVVGDGYFTNHVGIGLGASSPSNILEVDNNVAGQGLRITEGTGAGGGTLGIGIEFKRSSDDYLGQIFAQNVSSTQVLGYNSRNGHRFYDNGNLLYIMGDGGTAKRMSIGLAAHGSGKFNVSSTTIGSGHSAGDFTVTNTNASQIFTGVSGLSDGVGSLVNRGAYFEATGGISNYALVTGGGFVGINNTSPTTELDVTGTASISGNVIVDTLSGGGTLMVVTDNGGVLGTQSIPSGGGDVSSVNGLTGSIVLNYAETLASPAADTIITVTHSLSSTDIHAQAWDGGTGELIFPKFNNRLTDSVDVTFVGSAPSSARIIIKI